MKFSLFKIRRPIFAFWKIDYSILFKRFLYLFLWYSYKNLIEGCSSFHLAMRKDYFLSKAPRLSDFWTDNWEKCTKLPAPAGVQNREEYALIKPFLDRLSSNAKILDAGCGLGEWTAFLSQENYETVGLDLSFPTLRRLQETYPEVDFVCGSVLSTSFPASHFDAVISWGVFEHFENGLKEPLNEAFRVLKPGGYLFLSVPFYNWRHIFRDALSWKKSDFYKNLKWSKQKKYSFYQWRLTSFDLQQELLSTGFKPLFIQPVSKEQGIKRMLIHDFGFPNNKYVLFLFGKFLSWLIPKWFICHMLLGCFQKLESPTTELWPKKILKFEPY